LSYFGNVYIDFQNIFTDPGGYLDFKGFITNNTAINRFHGLKLLICLNFLYLDYGNVSKIIANPVPLVKYLEP